MFILQTVVVEDPYSLPVPQPTVPRRSVQDEIRNHLGNGSTGNGTSNNPHTSALNPQLMTSDEFISEMPGTHRGPIGSAFEYGIAGTMLTGLYASRFVTYTSVASGQILTGAQVSSYASYGAPFIRGISYVGRGAGAIGVASRLTPWLAPVGAALAINDWNNDRLNYYGTTLDAQGNRISNSRLDVRRSAARRGITLTQAQENAFTAELESQRGRDFAINTVCTTGGAAVGLALGVKGAIIGAGIGSFIPLVGTAIGAVLGGAIGFCMGAGLGNLAGKLVKGFLGLFGGRRGSG